MGNLRATLAAALPLLLLSAAQASAQDMPQIRVGESVQGSIETTDELIHDGSYADFYTLRATSGTRIEVTLSSSDFDAYLLVLHHAPDGLESIGTDDDGASGTDARLAFDAPATGSYVIIANSLQQGETGSYTLRVAELASTSAPERNVIRSGETVRGRLETTDARRSDGSYFDLYSFRGTAGDRIQIDMFSDAFDTYLLLGHSPGIGWTMLESNDDHDGLDSRITFTLPATGEYMIRANSLLADRTGDYGLRLQVEPAAGGAPSAAGGLRILAGETRVGRLDPGDPTLPTDNSYFDGYRYDGQAGERVTITLRSDDFDAYLSVVELDGGESLGSDDDGAGGTDSRLELTLPRTGSYLIRANSLFDGVTGAYTLQVESAR